MSGKEFADSDYALMDYSETYSEFDDISEQLSEKVFERDGRKWWLCNSEVDLVHIMRQIDDLTAFSRFRENATIPFLTANPSHPENLFPFCVYCHEGYDAAFSDWVLIPDSKETLRTYIDHEKNDYEQRYLVSQKSCSVRRPEQNSLPSSDHNPANSSKKLFTHWPKRWLGEPTTIIHRAVCHGLFNSNPIQPLRLGRGRMWQIGVPDILRDTCWRADWFVGKATTGGPGQKPDSERKQQSHGFIKPYQSFIKPYHYILVIV